MMSLNLATWMKTLCRFHAKPVVRNRPCRQCVEELEVRLVPSTLSVTGFSIEEFDGLAVFFVNLSEPTNQTVTVDVAMRDGTATDGLDYLASTAQITYPAGQFGFRVVRVRILEDLIQESDEEFSIELRNATNAQIEEGKGTALAVIRDNDSSQPPVGPEINVEQGGTTILDDSPTPFDFGVVQQNIASPEITFTITNAGDQALSVGLVSTDSGDFEVSQQPASSVAPRDSTTFQLRMLTNTTGGKSANVVFSNGDGDGEDPFNFKVSGTVDAVILTPTVTLALTGSPMDEAGGSATVTATLSAALSQNVTVNLQFAGTAALTSDYTRSADSISIPAGSLSGTVSLLAVQDSSDEPNETVVVDISSVTNANEADSQQVIATIIDDDPPSTAGRPTASLTAAGVVTGGALTYTFTVTYTDDLAIDVTSLDSSDVLVRGPNSFSQDATFVAVDVNSNGTPRSATYRINVPGGSWDAVDNGIYTVEIHNIQVHDTGNNYVATGSIGTFTVNVSSSALPTVTLSLTGSPVAEAGGIATVTAALSAVSTQNVIVNLVFSGTAALTSDYTRSNTAITIPAGSLTGAISLTAKDDAIEETDDTIIVNISTVTGANEVGIQQVTATISDDDTSSTPHIFIDDAIVVEGDAGQVNAVFTVHLSKASTHPVKLKFAAAPVNGTASSPDDFRARNGTLTFPAGRTDPRTIIIPVKGDLLNEADEIFFVYLSELENAIFADAVGQGTIKNDDPPPTLSINNAQPVSEGTIGNAVASFTVSLSAPSGQVVTVQVATTNNSAIAGNDYQATNELLIFNPGDRTKTFNVPISNDTVIEGNETFFVNLTTRTNAIIGNSQGIGTIVDDDAVVSQPRRIFAFFFSGDLSPEVGSGMDQLRNDIQQDPTVSNVVISANVFRTPLLRAESKAQAYVRAFLKKNNSTDGDIIVLFGHSHGGNLAYRLASDVDGRGTPATGLVTFDPIDWLLSRRLNFNQSDNPHELPRNVLAVNILNFLQRNPNAPLPFLQGYEITGAGRNDTTLGQGPDGQWGTPDDTIHTLIDNDWSPGDDGAPGVAGIDDDQNGDTDDDNEAGWALSDDKRLGIYAEIESFLQRLSGVS